MEIVSQYRNKMPAPFGIALIATLLLPLAVQAQSDTHETLEGERIYDVHLVAGARFGASQTQPSEGKTDEKSGLIQLIRMGRQNGAYGVSRLDLRVGSRGIGLKGQDHEGFSIVGAHRSGLIAPRSPVFVHLGVEPFSLSYNLDSDSKTLNYLEWTPMASLGVQGVLSENCKVLALVRGGAAVGTLGTSVGRGAYGLGGYLSCWKLGASLEATRILSNPEVTDVQSATVTSVVPGLKRLSAGVQADRIVKRAAESTPTQEAEKTGDASGHSVTVVVGGRF